MSVDSYFAVDRLEITMVDELLAVWLQAKERTPRANLYALVDTAFDEQACAEHLRQHHSGAAASLYAGTSFDELESVSPWLIHLSTKLPELLKTEIEGLVALRGARPMLSFVSSNMELGLLQRHFRPFVRVIVDDDLPLFLRFADTRILEPLFAVLSPDQRNALVTPNMGFWFPRRKYGLIGGVLPDPDRSAGRVESAMALDAVQFATLLRASEPDLVVQGLATTDPLRFDNCRPSDVYTFFSDQVDRAHSHGVTDAPNIEIYCTTAWVTGPDFDKHPDFAMAIGQARRSPGELANILADVPEAAWRQTRAGMAPAAA